MVWIIAGVPVYLAEILQLQEAIVFVICLQAAKGQEVCYDIVKNYDSR